MPGGRGTKRRNVCSMSSRLLETSASYLCHNGVMILVWVFLFPFLKQYLQTVGKLWILKKWDSAVQRIKMFWSNMPASSKILLHIVKATCTSSKSLHSRQRIKAASFVCKTNMPVQGKGVMFEGSLASCQAGNFRICFLILVHGNSLGIVQCLMKII